VTKSQYNALLAAAIQTIYWEDWAIFDCYDLKHLDDYGRASFNFGDPLF
jgi:hypothetical protein